MKHSLNLLLRPFRKTLSIAIILQIVAGISSLIPWIALSQLADLWQVKTANDQAINYWLIVLIISISIGLICQALALHITHLIDANFCQQLRLKLIKHLQQLPLGWFVKQGSDGVARLANQDVGALHQLIAHAPTDITQLFVLPITIFSLLLWVNSNLLFFAIIPLLLSFIGFMLIRSSLFKNSVITRNKAMEQLMANYGEFSSHLLLARQYPHAGIQYNVATSAEKFNEAFSQWVKKVGKLAAINQVLLGSPFLLAWVILGILLIGSQTIALSQCCLFILLIRAMAAPIQAMGHGSDALQSALLAANRLNQVLTIPSLSIGNSQQIPTSAQMTITDVNFSYEDKAILQHISFTLKEGTTTAIVGPSGAGKSTLLLLLARFMDPSQGQITLAGIDIKQLPSEVLYQHLSIVLQDPPILAISLAENISLFNPNATIDEIKQVAKSVCLDDKINSLPKGYDSIYSQDIVLSGGELQRLALARALLLPNAVLLLDEPTSALDPLTIQALQQVFYMKGKTRLIISHDLLQARHADHILVMEQGNIVAQGTHQQLLTNNSLYQQMWTIQNG